ncbi:MAG TPA: GNAT family protein [Anaerolineae bacterium]|jgi:ribosomal-protein-alanine N-acetyltransferase|nr:GNAT family protein [Anaerolineae bacterium]
MRQVNLPLPAFPELETPNLRLREMVRSDAEAVFRVFADEEVTRYYDLERFGNLEEARSHIANQAIRYRRGDVIRWGISQKANNVLIGSVGLSIYEANAQGGLGYELARPYWRRGIMSEALGMVIRFGFSSLNLNRLQALVMPGNGASAGLLTKLGFTREGLLREFAFFKGRYQDLYCYSLLRRECRRGE